MQPCLEPATVDLLTGKPPNPTLPMVVLKQLDDGKAKESVVAVEGNDSMA